MTSTAIDRLTKDDYKRAFLAVRPIAEHHRELLRTHFRAPAYTMTATQLARHMGYPNHNSVNLHYGTFADRICDVIGQRPEVRLDILVTFHDSDGPEEHLQLVLRPQVVEALQELKWY